MPPPASPSHRLDSLDGWRALAILLVLVSHIPFSVGAPKLLCELLPGFINGNLGVRIFFTISGFIITWLLLKELDTDARINLPQFYIRRALRILPVYFGYLCLLFVLQSLGRVTEDSSSWLGSLSFTRNSVGRGNSPSIHLWSLAIEEQFYLCWPPLLALLYKRKRLLLLIIGAVILSAPLMRLLPETLGGSLLERIQGPRSFFRYTDTLMIGCLAALLFKSSQWTPSRHRAGLALLLLILLEWLPYAWTAPLAFLIPLIEALAAAELMLWTMNVKGLAHSLLNSRPLVTIGLLSYSLYIWHTLFLDHFSPGLLSSIGLDSWYLWWIPSLLCALASYALLEWPARYFRAKRRSFPSSPGTV